MLFRLRFVGRATAGLALAVLLALPAAGQERVSPEEVGLSSERLDRLTRTMEEYVEAGRLPGAVVLVMREGRIAYWEAFGRRDVEAGEPQEPDDIFRIASQTKAIVSTAVMMLQEEGRLASPPPPMPGRSRNSRVH